MIKVIRLHVVSDGKIIEIYNKGISKVIGVIKELSNAANITVERYIV
jgi:hypothetical protein